RLFPKFPIKKHLKFKCFIIFLVFEPINSGYKVLFIESGYHSVLLSFNFLHNKNRYYYRFLAIHNYLVTSPFKENVFDSIIFTFTIWPINDSSPLKLTSLFCLVLPISLSVFVLLLSSTSTSTTLPI
ncbi:hypothetical protein EDD79_10491, partial [Serpentinicella alkaliphila]